MNRLLEAGLIYDRLLPVTELHLIERYNKALAGLGMPPTKLPEFDIDMLGFSPQIADELNDRDYLDPNRVNRRFIIMTPEQENLPVIQTSFSNTAGLMHEFFEANARTINAVTIRDALYGEIEDSVSVVDSIDDLLSINEVTFRVLSAEDMLGKAAELRNLTDRLTSVPDAWRNDELLNRMVELAKLCGDIRQNALVPDKLVFRHDSYWANHFGGVFVFRDDKTTTVICDPSVPGFRKSRPWQVSYIPHDDPAMIYDFLARTNRIDLPQNSTLGTSGLLAHRAGMCLEDLINANDPDMDLEKVDTIWRQTWLHRNVTSVTKHGIYPFLQEAIRTLSINGTIKMSEIEPRRRFLLIRARATDPDQWLTNRLISQMVPFDFVSRFIFDKESFYSSYATYSEKFKDHVVTTLTNTYLKDKKAYRAKLYGIGDDHDA